MNIFKALGYTIVKDTGACLYLLRPDGSRSCFQYARHHSKDEQWLMGGEWADASKLTHLAATSSAVH